MKRGYARVRRKNVRGEMNRWEREYAFRLDIEAHAGAIREWAYEPERLRIGDPSTDRKKKAAFYSPDFRVVNANGFVEFHEIKGHWEEAAMVRIKAAAAQHPYTFVAVTRSKQGEWEFESFGQFEEGDDAA